MKLKGIAEMLSPTNIKQVGHSIAPWVSAIIIFFGVSYIFYAPQFDDKSLAQGDIEQYAGMSKDIKEHREATGEDPQWTGNMFSGMPAYLIDVEYPEQYVKQGASAITKLVDNPMNMTFMAMLMMMVAVVLMGVSPWIGIIAGLAYGLSTYFFLIIDAGHITKMWALVYAPPLIGAVWYALRKSMWLGAALAALFGSLELGANHPQITYYFLIVCVALWCSELARALRKKSGRDFSCRSAVLAVAALLAVGSNVAPLYYTMAHQKHTTRGASEIVDAEEARSEKIAYNTAWSYGIAESCNMLVPNYMGAWSGDINRSVVELLQRRSVDDAIFDLSVEQMVDILRDEGYDVRSSDVMYALEAGDEATIRDVETIYSTITNEAYSYASNYWGSQPYTAGPTYLGAVVVLLAIFALTLLKWRTTLWVVVSSVLAILMAWGANVMGFYEVLYDILPGYSSFRTVSMALVVVEWSAPLLAAVGIYQLIKSKLSAKQLLQRLGIAYGVVVAIVVLMFIVADYGLDGINAQFGDGLWVEQLRSAAYEARHGALVADSIRTLIYVSLAAGVVLLYVKMREKSAEPSRTKVLAVGVAAVLGVVMVCDLVGVAKRYINDQKWYDKQPTQLVATEADRAILADDELGFRVFDFSGDPFNSARASYFHRSVGGYHGAKLGRYMDVIDNYLNLMDGDMLAALNTKYLIYEGEALPMSAVTGYEPYGAAWFVASAIEADSPRQALDMLDVADLALCAVVEREGMANKSYDSSGTVALVEYAPNYLKYEYETSDEALCIFSEIYYADGWSVTIDGEPADYFVADYVLRAMELPAGKHVVEWSFKAPNWTIVSIIMAICSIAIIVALIAVIIFRKELTSESCQIKSKE